MRRACLPAKNGLLWTGACTCFACTLFFWGGHAFGGHLNEAHISATAELVVRCLPGSTERRFDDEVGLNLIAF